MIHRTATLRDVSSNLKEGDQVTIFYKGTDVRIRTQDQSNIRNTMIGVFGTILLIVCIVSSKLSKSNNEYDELSGDENIYHTQKDYY